MSAWSQVRASRSFVVLLSVAVLAALVKNPEFALLIMAVAYVQNTTYSMESLAVPGIVTFTMRLEVCWPVPHFTPR